MTWVIHVARRGEDTFYREIRLDEVLRAYFRTFADAPADDPLYDSIPLDTAAVQAIAAHLGFDPGPAGDEFFLDFYE